MANAVAAFYRNASFSYRSWSDIEDLQNDRRIVAAAVFRNDPSGFAFGNIFVGHDLFSCRDLNPSSGRFQIRQADVPPGIEEAKQAIFTADSNTFTIGEVLPNPAVASSMGMKAGWYTMAFAAPGYDDLVTGSFTKASELAPLAPPLDGTY